MNEAKRITVRLRQRYSEWTQEREQGKPAGIPYLRWTDYNARDAYWLICKIWKFQIEA